MQAKKSERSATVPTEHGFWVMLAIALLAGVARAGATPGTVAVAIGLGLSTIFVAGRFHAQVRKSPVAQVLSSAALGLLLVPIEGIGQVPAQIVAADAAAWVPVFSGFSLSVRAIFARARKGGSGAPLTLLALALPLASGLALYWVVGVRNLPVSLVGFTGALVFAIWRPRPRLLKQSGVLMTVLLVLALLLVLGL